MNDFEKEIVDFESNNTGFKFALYLTPPRDKKGQLDQLNFSKEKMSCIYETETSSKEQFEDKELLPNDLFQKINEISPTKSFISNINKNIIENDQGSIDSAENNNFLVIDKLLDPSTNNPCLLSYENYSKLNFIEEYKNLYNFNNDNEIFLNLNAKRNLFTDFKSKQHQQQKSHQNFETYPDSYHEFNKPNKISPEEDCNNGNSECKDCLKKDVLIKKKKKVFMERKGDWVCMRCKNLNFSFRVVCNRCRCQKIDSEKQYEDYFKRLQNCVKINESYQNQVIQPSMIKNNIVSKYSLNKFEPIFNQNSHFPNEKCIIYNDAGVYRRRDE